MPIKTGTVVMPGTGSQVKVLNWCKVNFDGIRQDLAELDWSRMFVGNGMAGKLDAFKTYMMRVEGMRVPVEVKAKAAWSKEPWMTRKIEAG